MLVVALTAARRTFEEGRFVKDDRDPTPAILNRLHLGDHVLEKEQGSVGDAWQALQDGLERAGLPAITFHELRHTFGTQLAAGGVPLRTIQEWMGHADAKTTEVYRHYAPDPTHGADLVEEAFAQRSNLRSNLSKTRGTSEGVKPLWNAESYPG